MEAEAADLTGCLIRQGDGSKNLLQVAQILLRIMIGKLLLLAYRRTRPQFAFSPCIDERKLFQVWGFGSSVLHIAHVPSL